MSSFLLKIIACFTMSIDHIGLVFFPTDSIFRIIGRIAMPIFAFQTGIGFKYTKSKLKYILRMLICAIISQIPFLLMANHNNILLITNGNFSELSYLSLNICFTFTLALLILYFIDIGQKQPLFFIVSLFLILLSIVIPMDYGFLAVLLVMLSYFLLNKKIFYTIGFILISLLNFLIDNIGVQLFMLLAIPFIFLYNGKKGKSLKYYFYIFYPLHMLIIVFVKLYIL